MSSSSSPCRRVNQRSSAGGPPCGSRLSYRPDSTSSAPTSVACSRSGSRSRVGADTAGVPAGGKTGGGGGRSGEARGGGKGGGGGGRAANTSQPGEFPYGPPGVF